MAEQSTGDLSEWAKQITCTKVIAVIDHNATDPSRSVSAVNGKLAIKHLVLSWPPART